MDAPADAIADVGGAGVGIVARVGLEDAAMLAVADVDRAGIVVAAIVVDTTDRDRGAGRQGAGDHRRGSGGELAPSLAKAAGFLDATQIPCRVTAVRVDGAYLTGAVGALWTQRVAARALGVSASIAGSVTDFFYGIHATTAPPSAAAACAVVADALDAFIRTGAETMPDKADVVPSARPLLARR